MKRTFLSLLFILSIVSICDAQNLLPKPNKKGVWGYVDERGKYSIKPTYQSAGNFTSGLACVKINDAYGYINKIGQFVISPSFEFAEPFDGQYAKCRKNGKYGYIDKSGATVIAFEFSDISHSENASFLIGKKDGDPSQYIISILSAQTNRFDSVSSESYNGYYAAYTSGKVGYIHSDGKIAIQPTFVEKPSFSKEGIAISHKETGYGIITSSLVSILPEKYTFVKILDNGYYIYGNDEAKFGMVSGSGKSVFDDNTYTHTKFIGDGKYIEGVRSDSTAILDMEGNVIVANCDSYSVNGAHPTNPVGRGHR